ncbi:MAG: glycosyltransferase family 2 protein [Nanoarchaeota archaeon]|nr:glycosyltransferase family 2 protein [Nanoarchaeota archaeon]
MVLLEELANIVKVLFLLIILSYYVLFFIRKRVPKKGKLPSLISILVPAHNEEKYLAETLRSIIRSNFPGKKEIIVIDDGSSDSTNRIAEGFPVRLFKTQHFGKARALNFALKKAKGDIIAVVDADSVIEKNSLINALRYFNYPDVGAVTTTIKLNNRKTFFGIWLHIEQLYNSLLRSLLCRINANIVTPGPLSFYRKKTLEDIGGFESKGFSEDVDIAVRIIRNGQRIEYSENSVSLTNMPQTLKGVIFQRIRFARGWINILKRHLRVRMSILELYSLPLAVFSYLQAIILGAFISIQIFGGYFTYFVNNGVIFSFEVVKFFFNWFSIMGVVRWIYTIVIGTTPLDLLTMIGLISTLLSYPLYFYSIFKFDKKFDFYHAIALFFMFPFWFFVMIIYIVSLFEFLVPHKENKWEKQI